MSSSLDRVDRVAGARERVPLYAIESMGNLVATKLRARRSLCLKVVEFIIARHLMSFEFKSCINL